MDWTIKHIAIIAFEILGTIAIAMAGARLAKAWKRMYAGKGETAVGVSARNTLKCNLISAISMLFVMLLWIAGTVLW